MNVRPLKPTMLLLSLGIIAGCAQQPNLTLVTAEPVFNKFGEGECEDGLVLVPGTTPEFTTCIPDDCEPTYDPAGSIIDCPPPRDFPRDDDDDDDRREPGRDPGRGSGGTPTLPGTTVPTGSGG